MRKDIPDYVVEGICKFLVSSALADHLGDIRDAEWGLYDLLDIGSDEVRQAWRDIDYAEPLDLLKLLATRHDLPLPEWVFGDDES